MQKSTDSSRVKSTYWTAKRRKERKFWAIASKSSLGEVLERRYTDKSSNHSQSKHKAPTIKVVGDKQL